jgi:phosphopantetheinyl transferase
MIKRIINNFLEAQKLQKTYIQSSLKTQILQIPEIEKDMHAYKVRHAVHLLKTT